MTPTRSRVALKPESSSAFDATRILYSDDCLNVLNDELALPANSVDLIYLDPPFNSKSIYNLPFAGKDRDARPVEAFTDTWTWGTKEDDLLAELASGPQSRYLADVVALAQHIERGGQTRTAYRPIWSTWRCGSCQCAGFSRQQVPSTCIATTRPAIISSW